MENNKIEIKSYFGKILFEYEKEDNTMKDTLIEAVKKGADLQGADLQGANLHNADLRGVKIKRAIVFTGLYKYIVMPIIAEDGKKWVKMGCYLRMLSEWEADFWNNDNEFPNDNSETSNLRLFAFETAKKWFEIIN
jgi:hypothetical protein